MTFHFEKIKASKNKNWITLIYNDITEYYIRVKDIIRIQRSCGCISLSTKDNIIYTTPVLSNTQNDSLFEDIYSAL